MDPAIQGGTLLTSTEITSLKAPRRGRQTLAFKRVVSKVRGRAIFQENCAPTEAEYDYRNEFKSKLSTSFDLGIATA
jgi:hypothetical protein